MARQNIAKGIFKKNRLAERQQFHLCEQHKTTQWPHPVHFTFSCFQYHIGENVTENVHLISSTTAQLRISVFPIWRLSLDHLPCEDTQSLD